MNNTIIEKWITAAKNNEPVWIGDVRESFSEMPDCLPLSMIIILLDGTERVLDCAVPDWHSDEEKMFLAEYLCSFMYNALSALGGKKYELHYDRSNEKLRSLAEEAEQKLRSPDKGFSRIIRETERIARLTPESGTCDKHEKSADSVSAHLRSAAEKALSGTRIGIDVGGTDIKFAVSVNGHLSETMEYDWNPGSFSSAAEIIEPILSLTGTLLERSGAKSFDGIGLSFPDVVMLDRICGGETPKTQGIRCNPDVDYETEFSEIASLGAKLSELCRPGAPVKIANDGSVAAFTSAVEISFGPDSASVEEGAFSHALGTSLGTGWINRNCEIPLIPLEFYDSVIDLGSSEKKNLPAGNLCSTCSNSGVQSVDRYLGQASAFRYAYEEDPELLNGFITESCSIISEPSDMRKPCLEHLMREAEKGNPAAERVFTRIGESFAQISREIIFLLNPETDKRYLFGRFVKYQKVFELIKEGFESVLPGITLLQADDSLAFSPLMRELAERKDITVAQFGQAVGSTYFSGM
ncbi:MAG: hypothetical protein Q4F31_02355 [Eubacteriales bacterium]|nr:hypothetical protein [Eubacteriales bacterium]